ncbi:MAG: glycosyltransferase [Bacteroidota bacterium]|nr:glycosyltransferase [Bacteroidota bacterium]
MKIAGVVILYNPSKDVVSNINSYLPFINRLYVVDNSENSALSILQDISIDEKVIYIHDGENKGIAERLNQVVEIALAEGFERMLTMDQDSFFTQENITAYLNCVNKFNLSEKVGIFGVEFENKLNISNNCESEETDQLITSGSILNLKLCKEIGKFDEALFIDEVDLEFCYRLISSNYKVIKFSNVTLNHQLGHIYFGRSLKSFKKTPRTLHSPARVYYMVRNYLYVKKKYAGKFIESDKSRRKALLTRLKNNLLYSNNKLGVLRYIIKGISDFYLNNMGRLNKKSLRNQDKKEKNTKWKT